LRLTERDAAALGFTPFQDDKSRGWIQNMLIWSENSILTLPVMEATLSTLSLFPGNTRDFRVDNVDGLLFYKDTTTGWYIFRND
jgi:hypothetical protein